MIDFGGYPAKIFLIGIIIMLFGMAVWFDNSYEKKEKKSDVKIVHIYQND